MTSRQCLGWGTARLRAEAGKECTNGDEIFTSEGRRLLRENRLPGMMTLELQSRRSSHEYELHLMHCQPQKRGPSSTFWHTPDVQCVLPSEHTNNRHVDVRGATRRGRILSREPTGTTCSGSVARFYDTSREQCVAIKRIGEVFRDPLDAKRILRELKVLRHLRNRRNIVNLLDVLPPNSPDFDEIYIVLECLETDLHKYMQSRACDEHLRSTIFNLLRAFVIVHKAGVLHRDVKPSNVLIDQHPVTGEPEVRLCDFGLARQWISSQAASSFFSLASPADPQRCPTASTATPSGPPSPSLSPLHGVIPEKQPPLTEYVVTRWYRAPEILLNTGDYGPGVDIWGLGCVIAEMIKKQPLFTGWNNDDQIVKICRTLGKPVNHYALYKSVKCSGEAQQTRNTLENLPPYPGADLAKVFLGADAGLVDLLSKMLVVDPAARWTAEQALYHPYFQDYIPRSQVPKDTHDLKLMDWDFDSVPLIKRSVQIKIYEEIINHWHPEIIYRDHPKIIHFDIQLPPHLQRGTTQNRIAHSSRTKRRRPRSKHDDANAEKRFGLLSKFARLGRLGHRLLYSSNSSEHNPSSDDLENSSNFIGNDYIIPINN
eukprot:Gregarina_sp_Poly_1__589@NODE_113_length_13886_cov_267_363051_g100_i0_p3_GENE_NODE_113_length_13886_cov_267_363051_g100_i0NODE_113_length_13886_cov_267_363051_g100_i0_p3_ORF_typecomplete_len599_score87_19Pkinase/PF00069_25/5_3e52Pkinase_Tyr/PF07714_17/2_6e17Pkinase_Tyr/PF07714_17/0_0016Kdo/PF06293_14/3e13Pkinase_fungal/PF17667_1/4_9e09Kinaselike/PF14531_6/0_0061Kinaselike/PF14531_6/27YrbLPhoP_reg/PF10707_9/1e03YrbLPhoP_reg/PF10707_9/0_0014RIO1/PF01163_22/0_00062APH/PF01636_23/0_022APH/PF01636_23